MKWFDRIPCSAFHTTTRPTRRDCAAIPLRSTDETRMAGDDPRVDSPLGICSSHDLLRHHAIHVDCNGRMLGDHLDCLSIYAPSRESKSPHSNHRQSILATPRRTSGHSIKSSHRSQRCSDSRSSSRDYVHSLIRAPFLPRYSALDLRPRTIGVVFKVSYAQQILEMAR